jgi:hypothetical protein
LAFFIFLYKIELERDVMTMYKCPICLKEYSESTFEKCECGFENFNAYNSKEELLFQICDILSPLTLTLRSGSFSLNTTNVVSINELSPYVLGFR